MKAGRAVLLAIVAAATMTSVAAAVPAATKQRVMFTTQAAHTTNVSPLVLAPLQAGGLRRDSGTLTASPASERIVMRAGQKVSIYEASGTFKGKLGSFLLRTRSEWVGAGNGYQVAAITWTVAHGTGQYAGVTGGGRGASVWQERTDRWSSLGEGVLTLR